MRLDIVEMNVNKERMCVGIEDLLMQYKLKISNLKEKIVLT